MNTLFSNNIFHLIFQSDTVTKITLLILLILSICCWTIAAYKFIILKIKIFQCTKIKKELTVIKNLNDYLDLIKKNEKNYSSFFCSELLTKIKLVLKLKESNSELFNTKGLDLLNLYFEQQIDTFTQNEKTGLTFLSLSTSISPLLGLFGTVWGLVHSFVSISEKKTADIAIVAPGIAEALITTIAGLCVAIPALVLFYSINSKIQELEINLTTIATTTFEFVQENLITQNKEN